MKTAQSRVWFNQKVIVYEYKTEDGLVVP